MKQIENHNHTTEIILSFISMKDLLFFPVLFFVYFCLGEEFCHGKSKKRENNVASERLITLMSDCVSGIISDFKIGSWWTVISMVTQPTSVTMVTLGWTPAGIWIWQQVEAMTWALQALSELTMVLIWTHTIPTPACQIWEQWLQLGSYYWLPSYSIKNACFFSNVFF